jgi:hypothetical protein
MREAVVIETPDLLAISLRVTGDDAAFIIIPSSGRYIRLDKLIKLVYYPPMKTSSVIVKRL